MRMFNYFHNNYLHTLYLRIIHYSFIQEWRNHQLGSCDNTSSRLHRWCSDHVIRPLPCAAHRARWGLRGARQGDPHARRQRPLHLPRQLKKLRGRRGAEAPDAAAVSGWGEEEGKGGNSGWCGAKLQLITTAQPEERSSLPGFVSFDCKASIPAQWLLENIKKYVNLIPVRNRLIKIMKIHARMFCMKVNSSIELLKIVLSRVRNNDSVFYSLSANLDFALCIVVVNRHVNYSNTIYYL